MILNALRWFSRLDRSYFFAISALISALIVSIALTFAPIAQRVDGSDVSLIERDGAIILILLILPVFVLATPLIALPQAPGPRLRSHKINSAAATVVLVGFAAVSLPTFGLFYGPSLIFSMASSVSLFFGRDRKPGWTAGTAKRNAGSDGTRSGRNARKRFKKQEEPVANGAVKSKKGESPLVSSRRRRGRNRRKK